MSNDAIVSLLGLCLRGRNLAVGDEAAADAAGRLQARLLLLSEDAAPRTRRRAETLARRGRCLLETLPVSSAQLGGALGRSSAAICAVTDTGLAAALVRRMEGLYPGRYAQTLDRLSLKLRRAAERRQGRRDAPRTPKAPAAPKGPPGGAGAAGRRGKPFSRPSPPEAAAPRRQERQMRRRDRKPVPKSGGEDRAHRPRSGGDQGSPRHRTGRYAHSRPVKKGKGSFPKKGR